MNANEFLTGLRADPQAFLRRHIFYVAGLPSSIAPVTVTLNVGGAHPTMLMPTRLVPPSRGRFVILPDDTQFSGFQTGRAGRRNETKQRDKFNLRPAEAASPAVQVLEAWFVPMTDQVQETVSSYIVLPGSGGPDVALTPQMSGCSFGVGSPTGSGARIVSHTRSGQGGRADKPTFGQMNDVFDHASRPGPSSYGNIDNRATIVGLRMRGQWSFFAQTYRTMPNMLLSLERLAG